MRVAACPGRPVLLTKCNAVPAKPVFPPRPPPLILDSDGAPEVPTSAEPQSCVIGPPHAPRPLSPEPAAVTSPGPSLDLENPASSPVGGSAGDGISAFRVGFSARA